MTGGKKFIHKFLFAHHALTTGNSVAQFLLHFGEGFRFSALNLVALYKKIQIARFMGARDFFGLHLKNHSGNVFGQVGLGDPTLASTVLGFSSIALAARQLGKIFAIG